VVEGDEVFVTTAGGGRWPLAPSGWEHDVR